MNDHLTQSIEHLYVTFAKYQNLSKLEGSPVYDELEKWIRQLRSKPLRELTEDDLSLFAGKVILTWGDENDYRCYLPRIFELTAEFKTPYDIWTLYSRLEDANWKNWNIEERQSINNFTLELWKYLLNNNGKKAELEFKEYFHAIAYFYVDFIQLLDLWESNFNLASIKHLTNYIIEERQFLFDKNYINSTIRNTKNILQFKNWLTSDQLMQKIEKAFFEYEKSEVGEKISLVEQILSNERRFSV